MQWYYSVNDQQIGPVSQDELGTLLKTGTVTPDTLVWHDGMADWVPLQDVPGQPVEASIPQDSEVCAMCHGPHPADDMLRFEQTWICVGCKPLFVQTLKEGGRVGSYGLWRSHKTLVMHRDAELPRRCVKCNVATLDERMVRKLYWHTSLFYVLLLVNLMVYAIVALIFRKRARIEVSVCSEHRKRRANAVATTWVLVLTGTVAVITGGIQDSGALILGGCAMLLAAIIWGIWKARIVYARKIDNEHVWVNGICPEFLSSLPEWDR